MSNEVELKLAVTSDAVSYTHLDVYKRQPSAKAACPWTKIGTSAPSFSPSSASSSMDRWVCHK